MDWRQEPSSGQLAIGDPWTISRHPPIGWEARPSLVKEIEACQERLGEIEKAAGKAKRVWCLGNHDARFETRIATVAPEYAKIHGVHLRDHFPLWEPAWSAWVNDCTVVKHRAKSGTDLEEHLYDLGVTASRIMQGDTEYEPE